MESMTGYAFMERSTEQFSYSVELKSLNSRYLEIFINLPKILKNDENELHNLLKSRFERGKLELSIEIFDWVVTKPIFINADMIKKYYHELVQIHRKLGVAEPFRFESILALEGISHRERSVISRGSRSGINGTIAQIIAKAIDMRKKEGAAIKKDVAALIATISTSMAALKHRSKDIAKVKKELLKKRIEALLGSKIDDIRLYTEFAFIADKLDINEEIIRFNDHLKKFNALLKSDEQIGKKLDFLAQEMFREINTIGSKSNSSEISHLVVDIKNIIEMIREHCRNIV